MFWVFHFSSDHSFVRLSVRMYVINCCVTLCVKLSYLFLFSRKLNWNSFFVPRRQSKGTIILGSSVRRHNLVSATPPTVFKGFWWNFPDIVAMTWRCAYFIEVMLDWYLLELWPFNNFSAVNLVSATPLAVFSEFKWYLPVIVPMTWRGSYYTEFTLDRFLPEIWLFVSFSHFISTEVLVSTIPSTVFKGFWWNFPDIVAMTWRRYFIEVMLNWFLPQL